MDLIPEDDRNTYVCDSQPKHAAIAMDKFGYKLVLCPHYLLSNLSFCFHPFDVCHLVFLLKFQQLLCLFHVLSFFRLPYKMYFGGVSALSPLHYLKMNGFPNNYWGWGGEDDDIGIR